MMNLINKNYLEFKRLFQEDKAVLFLFISLVLILIIEGLGVSGGRTAGFIIYILSPIGLILWPKKSKLLFPKPILFALVVLFLVIIGSFIGSIDLESSFNYLLVFVATCAWVMLAFNHSIVIKKHLGFILISIGILFSFYSFFLLVMAYFESFFLIPDHGLQLVYPKFSSHNHLGDYLVLPFLLVISGISFRSNIWRYLLLIFFLVLICLSFSRSAYLSLTVVFTLLAVYFRQRHKLFYGYKGLIIIGLFVLLIGAVTASIPNEFKNLPVISEIHTLFRFYFGLEDKHILGFRLGYIFQAIPSIMERPLLGVGGGNFYYTSMMYGVTGSVANSSHNLLLDLFVELGFGGLLMGFMIMFLVVKFSRKDTYFYLWLVLLINFFTDYTFQIFSILVIFAVLTGVVLKRSEIELKSFVVNRWLWMMYATCVVVLVGQYILFARIGIFDLKPFNQEVFKNNIELRIKTANKSGAVELIQVYERLFTGKIKTDTFTCRAIIESGNLNQIRHYCQMLFEVNPKGSFSLAVKVYSMLLEEGTIEANNWLDNYFDLVIRQKGEMTLEDSQEIINFCIQSQFYTCHDDIWRTFF